MIEESVTLYHEKVFYNKFIPCYSLNDDDINWKWTGSLRIQQYRQPTLFVPRPYGRLSPPLNVPSGEAWRDSCPLPCPLVLSARSMPWAVTSPRETSPPFQTLRGQQGKRESLGTRLGCSNSQASNLTKYHFLRHKINHLCRPHLVYWKVPYKVTFEYNPAQSTGPRSKTAHHEAFGFKAKLSINLIGNVSVKTSFSKTITAISV